MKSSSRLLGESLAGFGTGSFRPVNSQPGFQRAEFASPLVGFSIADALATCPNEQLIFYNLNRNQEKQNPYECDRRQH
jgi:hypothetical protein